VYSFHLEAEPRHFLLFPRHFLLSLGEHTTAASMTGARLTAPFVFLALLSMVRGIGASTRGNLGDITWVSPVAGDTFRPGNSITAKWTSSNTVESPSFRLCMSDPPNGSPQRRSVSPSSVILRPSTGHLRSSRYGVGRRASLHGLGVAKYSSRTEDEYFDDSSAHHETAGRHDEDTGTSGSGTDVQDHDAKHVNLDSTADPAVPTAADDTDNIAQDDASCGDPLTPDVQSVNGAYIAIL
jgi:hypothetical protein